MAVIKSIDDRYFTRGGGIIRVEVWLHRSTGGLWKYNLAYVNQHIHAGDNGRVLGFDNSHRYPGFPTEHHAHWFGSVLVNRRFNDLEHTLNRFERLLGRLKQRHGRIY